MRLCGAGIVSCGCWYDHQPTARAHARDDEHQVTREHMVELRHLPAHATLDKFLRERDGVLDLLQALFDAEPKVLVEDGRGQPQ